MRNEKYQNKAHLWLAIAFFSLSISLIEPLMAWILVLVLVSTSMRIAFFLNWHYKQLSNRTINLLAILCAVVLAANSIQIGLLFSMVNMLVMASALKLMQLRNPRDYFLMICTQLFIVGCGLIFQQSIAFSFFYALVAFVLLVSLAYKVAPTTSLLKNARLVLKLSLQASPICLLMFLVLPKIEPLWQMPQNKSTETGLTEEMTPGDIANLSQSDDLAFRVEFAGNIPEAEERYWRALVLEDFDGKTWRVSELRKRAKLRRFRAREPFVPEYSGSDYYEYNVIVEPTNQTWLFSLDVPLVKTEKIWLSHDFQVQHMFPVVTKYKYNLRTYPETALISPLTYFDENINLRVPERGNPRTVVWVEEMRRRYPDDGQFIQAVEEFFVSEAFTYTLRPEPMLVNQVDTFLFREQSGFCAHYASAYAYIMRLAGIPARVVGGYQGGELRGDDYMSVYQYDAHAWVEIWNAQSGWQRKDPTGLVAPNRILFGLESAVAHENSFLEDSPFALAKLKGFLFLNELRLLMADLDFLWSSWVLGFDQEKQLDLFENILGDLKPGKIALLLLAALFVVALLLLLFNHRIWFPEIENPYLHWYRKLTTDLAKMGLPRRQAEGPEAYLARVASRFDEGIAHQLKNIAEHFIRFQYSTAQPAIDQKDFKQFRSSVRQAQKLLQKAR